MFVHLRGLWSYTNYAERILKTSPDERNLVKEDFRRIYSNRYIAFDDFDLKKNIKTQKYQRAYLISLNTSNISKFFLYSVYLIRFTFCLMHLFFYASLAKTIDLFKSICRK